METYGRSFAERISQDEDFRAEVRDRFERGRALGGFPKLSALLSGMTPEEQREFFETGWMRVALPPPRPPVYPWDRAPWTGDREVYREDLYSGLAFAQEWLEEFSRVGYYGMEKSLGFPIKQQVDDLSAMPGPLPLYGVHRHETPTSPHFSSHRRPARGGGRGSRPPLPTARAAGRGEAGDERWREARRSRVRRGSPASDER